MSGGRLVVAVSGHRPARLPADTAELRTRANAALAELRELGLRDGARPVVLSALAEGADRLLAEEATRLGFALEALLPFARYEYERDFPDPQSVARFRALLRRAEAVVELDTARADGDAAYARLGSALLDRADVLFAVWDGRPARGPGGTATVLAEAQARGIPLLRLAAQPPHALSRWPDDPAAWRAALARR